MMLNKGYEYQENLIQSASFILDLIHMRETGSYGLTREEVNDILEYLSRK